MATISVQGDGLFLIFKEIPYELAETITTKGTNPELIEELKSEYYYDFGLIDNIAITIDDKQLGLDTIPFDPKEQHQVIELGNQDKCYLVGEILERGEWFIYDFEEPYQSEKLLPKSTTYELPNGSHIGLIKVFYSDKEPDISTLEKYTDFYFIMSYGIRREIKLTEHTESIEMMSSSDENVL